MTTVIGIDAGGTKTVGLLADAQGAVLGEARGGGANLQTAGELEVEKVLDGILEDLDPPRRAGALCLGIAGVDQPLKGYDALLGQAQALARGDQHHKLRRRCQQRVHQRSGLQHMLKVIKHQQQLLGLERRAEQRLDRVLRRRAQPQRVGNAGRDQLGVLQRGQQDDTAAIA